MKISGLLPIIIFLLLPTKAIFSQGEFNYAFELEDLICKELENAEFHINQRDHRNPASDKTDIHYQVMQWEIDPAQHYITGEITYYFKSRVNNLSEMVFDLSDALTVNAVTRNGVALSYLHDTDQLLAIDLGKSLQPGDPDTLTVAYEGAPPSNGFGSFMQGTHAGQPIVWTLSEPYGVRDWWPGKQDLVDKIDSMDVYITTPLDQLAAGNGKLMSITEIDGKLVHHWRHRHPIVAYLVALAVTNYEAYSDFVHLTNGDSIEILNYVYPENLDQIKDATKSSIDIMTLFNDLVGTYPFADEKYGHAQFGWGGGMEHQTMSFMGSFSFSLQAHEMAHQWFGDKVTCGSWTEIWLNEGFATYLTGLTYENFSTDEYWPLWKSSTRNSIMSQPGGSVFVDDTTSVNRIFNGRLTYNKGAYLLHMLRWIVGDEDFFIAIRNYLDAPGTAFGFAKTAQLQDFLEDQSGIDLDEYFQDWYYGQGYPTYDLKWSQQSDSLICWLSQSTSHNSVSFFEMPVPVSVNLNGTPTTFVLDHTTQDQRFSFFIDNVNADSVVIDPDLWILSKDNTITEIITSVYTPIAQDKYVVFPNPVSDRLNIHPTSDIAHVEFIDILGVKRNIQFDGGSLALDNFPSGYYQVVLKNNLGEILSIKPVVVGH